jgi:hypothetical protein
MLFLISSPGRAWGPEGHRITVIVAERYLHPKTAARVRDLLYPESMENASVWADDYRHDHPETGAWHYINIPLAGDRINMATECPGGDCVVAKTKEFLAVLENPAAGRVTRARALRFVIHFVGDLHQPLHAEDNHDQGGNMRQVRLPGHVHPPDRPDNLHWLWDAGLLERINPEAYSLARNLERQITKGDYVRWKQGTIEEWTLEAHRLAQRVAYRGLGGSNPAVIRGPYEHNAEAAIELQLAKAGVRLAYLLNVHLL